MPGVRQNEGVMKVLVVKMSSMGDIVHAQPLVTDILKHFPNAKIDWVCEAAFAAIPAMHPGVADVIPISLRRWRHNLTDPDTRRVFRAFVKRLRQVHYDWVIDCQGLIKSAVISRLARASHRAGLSWASSREAVASLAYDRKALVPKSLHVVSRNRAVAAAALGYAVAEPARFGLRPPAVPTVWRSSQRAYAVLIPGASRDEKLWPEAHWQAVAKRLVGQGLQVCWLWGSAPERERVLRLARACGSVHDASAQASAQDVAQDVTQDVTSATNVLANSLVPPFLSVAQAAAMLADARVVVGLDTGFTHLAGALGRPTVGIFCDFDATQCAVTGDAPCESLGGVGQIPALDAVEAAVHRLLATAQVN
jgi:heptosyltransferase-1